MLPRRALVPCLSILAASAVAGACSAVGPSGHVFGTGAGSGGAGGNASGTGTGSDAVSTGDGFIDGGPGGSGSGGPPPMCSEETQYVYTIAADNGLYKFDPPTLKFT